MQELVLKVQPLGRDWLFGATMFRLAKASSDSAKASHDVESIVDVHVCHQATNRQIFEAEVVGL